jgi:hypothetical protein
MSKIILTVLFLFCMENVADATILSDQLPDASVGDSDRFPDAGVADPDRPPPPPPDQTPDAGVAGTNQPPPLPPDLEGPPKTPLNGGGLTAVVSAVVIALVAMLKGRRFWLGVPPRFRPVLPVLLGMALSVAAGFLNLVPTDVAAVSAALSGAASMGFYQLGKRRPRKP